MPGTSRNKKSGKAGKAAPKPEYVDPVQTLLRFGIGQKVLCNTGRWVRGTIVALNYTEPGWAPGQVSPYQVLLDDNESLIHVPADDPELCVVAPPRPPKAERFKIADHVIYLMLAQKCTRWLPGKVVEIDLESGDVTGSVFPYGISIDQRCGPPFAGEMVEAKEETLRFLRAETCFAAGMARWAAVHAMPPASAKLTFPKKMRFDVGAQVACRVDSKRDGTGQKVSWESGTVTAVRVPLHDGRGAAYQICLDSGDEVYASRDEHWLIRSLEHQKVSQCKGERCPSRFERIMRGDECTKFDHFTARAIPWDSSDDDDDD